MEEDVTKEEVRQKFIEHNIVDTRYASRVVLNTLQHHFKNTKISVVRGIYTSQLRRAWRINKTRETYHHHAIDVLIIAATTQTKLWKKQHHFKYNTTDHYYVDAHTGEILDTKAYKKLAFIPPYNKFLNKLKDESFYNDILFSYQVDSKYNRQITDATIYGTRTAQLSKNKKEEIYVIESIKDIYSKDGYESFIKKYNKDKTQFLMYHNDPQTFEKVIEVILNTYPNKKLNDKGKEVACNPFDEYRKEHGMMRKYSKKNNGPTVKKLKYYANKLGSHVDISSADSKNKTVLQSLKPWRTDVYFNGTSGKYELVGLKYSDLQSEKGTGKYHITLEKYNMLKKEQKVSKDSKFKFTLYKNDLLLIKDVIAAEELLVRVNVKNDSNPHYFEFKPYDKAKYAGNEELLSILGKVANSGQCLKSINKLNISLYKVKTDILGYKHFIKQEGNMPQLKF